MPRFQPSGRSRRAAFSTPSTSNNRIGTSVVADMWGSSQAATDQMRRSRPSIRASNLAGTSSTRGSPAGDCPVPADGPPALQTGFDADTLQPTGDELTPLFV